MSISIKELKERIGLWIWFAEKHYQIGGCTFHRMNGIRIRETNIQEPIEVPVKAGYGYCLLKDGDLPDNTKGDQFFYDNKWENSYGNGKIPLVNISCSRRPYRRPIEIPANWELVSEEEDANSKEYKWWNSKSKTWNSFRNTRCKAKDFYAVIRKKAVTAPEPPEGFYIETDGEYRAQKVDMFIDKGHSVWVPVFAVQGRKVKDLFLGSFIARPIKKDKAMELINEKKRLVDASLSMYKGYVIMASYAKEAIRLAYEQGIEDGKNK